ncbi:MAG: twin-arginine translocase subunit TatC [Chloroflexi bacterium]|nr:twin-arginine translocase subunit TatC [Chloroflexota bacterium]MCL5273150.1 twin-arginine translocase subunit TatC [Chloroflexota bacterium]
MNDEVEMTLAEHLEELRSRLIISVIAILITTAAVFFVSDFILSVLVAPSGGLQLKAFNITDGFMIKARIALYGGIVLAFPVWAFQIIRYVSPGLLDNERRVIFPALAFSLGLFIVGVIFGYVMLAGMIHALVQFFPPNVDLLPNADEYISFVLFFLLAAGIAFQLPTIMIVLVQLRILNTTFLRKQRKYMYFVLFAFSELITPVADPLVAPMIVMAPLVFLFELSVFLGRRIEAKRAREEAAEMAMTTNAIAGGN